MVVRAFIFRSAFLNGFRSGCGSDPTSNFPRLFFLYMSFVDDLIDRLSVPGPSGICWRKKMKPIRSVAVLVIASACLSGCAYFGGSSPEFVVLTGMQEVPPVKTQAEGKSDIIVATNCAVGGRVSVSGMRPTAAHIHQGAIGKNGPILIALTKSSDNEFTVPPNTVLSAAACSAYKAGNLYVNVHSGAYPAGELRAQLRVPAKTATQSPSR